MPQSILALTLLLMMFCAPVVAQESAVTAGTPEGPSSGEAIAEEAMPPPPPPCGTQPISIARMQWPSSAILAEIHARLLTQHYRCVVRVQMADQAAAGSSMATNGQPAVAPEMWISRVAEIWNAGVKAQKLRSAAPTYAETVFEGWFVPDYVVETTPATTTLEGLRQHWQSFMAGGTRGRFLSCPIDWACSVVNRNLLRAFGLDAYFDVIEPANRFELDTLIAEAVGRREPILFYYWQPNAVLSQFAFKAVDLGTYDRDAYLCAGRRACASPVPTGFPSDPVVIALAEWVYTDATQIAAYFQRARLPIAEMNKMLEQLGEPGATAETVADRFVSESEAVWRPWIGAGQ